MFFAQNVKNNPNASVSLRDKNWKHFPNNTNRGIMDHARLVLLGSLVPVTLDQVNILFFMHNRKK